ncbi:uncharacterized protein I206_104354 [Kwoniella pini CBS 10737]|uniref:DUF974 domain-containing protein n=1 Tax=Kwoniella pini CBS 10737 TaxID=1296096 RepID=A0A1B9I1W6_9TREE|nr:uncharacterized protein I206_04068 [Kwoniella pini CBS 10737]OCF49546.1 hypothetical protein I206_04068 [Kwoniella pini CBS 10737]
MEPPLTLIINQISPPNLIPGYIPSSSPPVPFSAAPTLPPPPSSFTLSPTANYPSPFGIISLGSTLSLELSLENTNYSQNDILGVKMMIECQGSNGRFRLGEIIHQNEKSNHEFENPFIEEDKQEINLSKEEEIKEDKIENLSILKFGEKVNIKIENEIKDLGLNILIISVAWETLEGRKTFQRFLKFNVNPPLSIKTRIQIPSSPNILLSSSQRDKIYLEILLQNISSEFMILNEIYLEPIKGLNSISLNDIEQENIILLPEDIRQFLFVLSPSIEDIGNINQSKFPPSYSGGTILPLGRLDINWKSGQYSLPGRLQTSTLNRRIPPSSSPAVPPKGGILPTRTLSSQSNVGSVGVPGSPLAQTRDRLNNNLLAPSPIKGSLPSSTVESESQGNEWEFDLTLKEDEQEVMREFEVEQRFKMNFKLGMRSTKSFETMQTIPNHKAGDDDNEDDQPLSRISSRVSQSNSYDPMPPKIPKIAVQYLTPLANSSTQSQVGNKPQLNILSPSRTNTPMSPTPSNNNDKRPFSPFNSRSGTPSNNIPNQLKLAQTQGLTSITNLSGIGNSTPKFNNIPLIVNNEDVLIIEGEKEEGFPPLPFIKSNNNCEIINLGNSLQFLKFNDNDNNNNKFKKVKENFHPTYSTNDNEDNNNNKLKKEIYKWEIEFEFNLEFIAFDQGFFELGGLRILIFNKNDNDDDNDEDNDDNNNEIKGKILKEWKSLGNLHIIG